MQVTSIIYSPIQFHSLYYLLSFFIIELLSYNLSWLYVWTNYLTCIVLHSPTEVKLIHNNSCTILNTHIQQHIITQIWLLISCKLLQSLTRQLNFIHSSIYSHSLSLNYTGIMYHGFTCESNILHVFSFIHPSSKADS